MLIAALEVDVRRPRQLVVARQHGLGPTGVEPDVEDVALALDEVPPQAGQVSPAGRNSSIGRSIPGVGSLHARTASAARA